MCEEPVSSISPASACSLHAVRYRTACLPVMLEQDPFVLHRERGTKASTTSPVKGDGEKISLPKKIAPPSNHLVFDAEVFCWASLFCSLGVLRYDDFGIQEYQRLVALLFLRSLRTTGVFTGFNSISHVDCLYIRLFHRRQGSLCSK